METKLEAGQKGTIRMLLAISMRFARVIDTAIVLGFSGEPSLAQFAFGDDLTNGDGDFGDYDEPAEFHHTDGLATGLWISEWDWEIERNKLDEDDEDHETELAPAYGEERWSRPTLADLAAFNVLPEPAHAV